MILNSHKFKTLMTGVSKLLIRTFNKYNLLTNDLQDIYLDKNNIK